LNKVGVRGGNTVWGKSPRRLGSRWVFTLSELRCALDHFGLCWAPLLGGRGV